MIGQRALLAVAIVAGVVAGGAYWATAQRAAIVVAARDLDADKTIAPEDVALRELPVDAVPVGALRTVADALGRVPRAPLWTGQILMAAGLGEAAGAFHSGIVPPSGQRAIAIPVTAAQALGGALVPGAHVDVIAVPAIGRAQAKQVTELVAANVTIVDVRGEGGGPFVTPGSARASAIGAVDRLGSVVVAVPPSEALRIADRIATSNFVLVFIPIRR